jgi:hypothetical protein
MHAFTPCLYTRLSDKHRDIMNILPNLFWKHNYFQCVPITDRLTHHAAKTSAVWYKLFLHVQSKVRCSVGALFDVQRRHAYLELEMECNRPHD